MNNIQILVCVWTTYYTLLHTPSILYVVECSENADGSVTAKCLLVCTSSIDHKEGETCFSWGMALLTSR